MLTEFCFVVSLIEFTSSCDKRISCATGYLGNISNLDRDVAQVGTANGNSRGEGRNKDNNRQLATNGGKSEVLQRRPVQLKPQTAKNQR